MADELTVVEQTAPPAATQLLSLVVVRYSSEALGNPFSIQFGPEGGSIGRAAEATLTLADFPPFRISAQHCAISYTDGAYRALDTSRNGTYLNDRTRRVSKSSGTQLANGDILLVGPYELLVVLASAQTGIQTRRGAEDAARAALLGGTGPWPDTEVANALDGTARTLMAYVEAILNLRQVAGTVRRTLDPESENQDATLTNADTRQLVVTLLKRGEEGGPDATAEDITEELTLHQIGLAAAVAAGPRALIARWHPAAITRRCDRMYRFTGQDSLDRKKQCMFLLEADFVDPTAEPEALPDTAAEEQPAPKSELAAALPPGPEPPPPFDSRCFALERSLRAYRKSLALKPRPDGGLPSCPPEPPRVLTISVIRHGGKPARGPSLKLCGEAGTIGRSETASLTLPDPKRQLTREHAAIAFADGDYVIVDQSRNGTFINSRKNKIEPGSSHHLRDGEHILIGDYELLVTISGGPFANAIAGWHGSPFVDSFAKRCGLLRSDLPTVDPEELIKVGVWRLRQLSEWLLNLDADRQSIRNRIVEEAGGKKTGGLGNRTAGAFSTLGDIRQASDRIVQQQQAILATLDASISSIIEAIRPDRLIEGVTKRTIYRADTFWGEVFAGRQRLKAWDSYVAERAQDPPGLADVHVRRTFLEKV